MRFWSPFGGRQLLEAHRTPLLGDGDESRARGPVFGVHFLLTGGRVIQD